MDFFKMVFSTPGSFIMIIIFLCFLVLAIIVLIRVARSTGMSLSKEKGLNFAERRRRYDDNCEWLPDALSRLEKIEYDLQQFKDEGRCLDTIKSEFAQVTQMLLFYSNAPNLLRIRAGLTYVREGGNGKVLADVHAFAAKFTGEYDCVCIMDQSLALPPDRKICREGA